MTEELFTEAERKAPNTNAMSYSNDVERLENDLVLEDVDYESLRLWGLMDDDSSGGSPVEMSSISLK